MPGLRRRRMGHVPQRSLHRTRDQGAARRRAERFRIEPEFVVKVDPALGILGVMLEPASILAKAWDHTERIGRGAPGCGSREACWSPGRARSASSPL